VVGLLIALIAAAIVKGILGRTGIDNRIGGWVTGRQGGADAPRVEKLISDVVFWIIFIFTIVATLQALRLTAVSAPLNNFLEQVVGYLPEIAGAAILLGIAWLLATIVKLIVTRALDAFGIDERLGQQVADPYDSTIPPRASGFAEPETTLPGVTGTTVTAPPPRSNQFSLSETIGNTLYWFVFLLFLPSILSTLHLEGTLAPVQRLLNDILGIIPNILAAILIGAVGWLLAQVVRRIVTNFLSAAGTDRLGSRFGLTQTAGSNSLSWIIGTIVYVLVLIPTTIAALNALRIDAISVPAIAMLNQILTAIPQIFTAVVILAIAYFIGHFLSELVTNILSGLGFDNIFYWLGLQSTPTASPVPPPAQIRTGDTIPPRAIAPTTTKTPSQVVGIIVLVGVMLFAAVAAINVLGIEALTALVSGIVVIFGRILAGLVVFAIGLYLANLAYTLITSSGGQQSRILGQVARISIIALVSAMALQQIGVASDIVNLAFGLLVGAIAVAIALAFGLGGRDVAADQIREWLTSFKQKQ
jgi:Conserved TM helix